MDFVPNHSSDLHPWFIKSVKKEGKYDNYYVWKDPKGHDSNGNPIPPNNWVLAEMKARFFYSLKSSTF